MLFLPYADIGIVDAQTVIVGYFSAEQPRLERVTEVALLEPTTVIDEWVFDSSPRVATRLREAINGTPIAIRDLPKHEQLVASLYGYLDLPANWDGYGGIAPPAKAVFDAERFLSTMSGAASLPKPMISGDGQVGLYWRGQDQYIEVTFVGDDRATIFAEKGGRSVCAENIPIEIASQMKHLFAYLQ